MWDKIIKKTPESRPQIFDLLQLSRKENDARLRCRKIMRELSRWKRQRAEGRLIQLDPYARIEGFLLRQHAQDCVMMWRMVRRERMRLFADYVDGLPPRGKIFRNASY